MSIVTYPLNGVTYNAEDAEGYLCTRTSGVFAAEDQFVASVTGDMEVTISPGIAWIKNTDFSGKSIVSRSAVALTVPTADGALPRRDRVVIRFDKTMNATEIKIKTGTPSSAATPPAVERTELVYELGLYTILVPAAALAISMTNITNTMLDESVCGVMSDAVTGLPTQQMNEQWQNKIDTLDSQYNALVEQLSEAVENVTGGVVIVQSRHRIDILAENWNQASDGTFQQIVSVAGLVETDTGFVDLALDDATPQNIADLMDAWAMIERIQIIDAGVLLTCFILPPEIDLSANLEVFK